MVYVPGTDVFTEPDVVIELDRSPSSVSDAVAPSSEYGEPSVITCGLAPFSAIIGGSSVTTSTVRVTVDVCPDESVTE